jgi:hypothetical protein
MLKTLFVALFAFFVALTAAHEHHHEHHHPTVKKAMEHNKIKVQEITFDCTYRCTIYNTCMMKGALNGDITKCGEEPPGCQCVW